MYRTFNMGIGMVLLVAADEAGAVQGKLAAQGETCYVLGKVVKGKHDVTIRGGVFRG